jgi:hypothetical protein
VDLQSGDVDASKSFYGALFGWTADAAPDPEAGGYTMFQLAGKNVAGLGPQMNPGPPAWATYVSVVDADDTVAKVKQAGGTVFMEPMDVLDSGRMAVFADGQGAALAIWQPKAHPGAQLVNEAGTFSWNELATRDIEGAKAFYGQVFGWEGQTHEMGPMVYTEWKVDGQSIGGMMEMGPQYPPDVPPHWLVYFTVDDCDGTVARAQELGGSVAVPAMDIPQGRFSVLIDPQGAVFAVIQMPAQAA